MGQLIDNIGKATRRRCAGKVARTSVIRQAFPKLSLLLNCLNVGQASQEFAGFGENKAESVSLCLPRRVVVDVRPLVQFWRHELTRETIVAVFPSRSIAEAARQDLEAAGFPAADIAVDAKANSAVETAEAAPRERGFLDWMFGIDEEETTRYRSHLETRDAAIVSIR